MFQLGSGGNVNFDGGFKKHTLWDFGQYPGWGHIYQHNDSIRKLLFCCYE